MEWLVGIKRKEEWGLILGCWLAIESIIIDIEVL